MIHVLYTCTILPTGPLVMECGVCGVCGTGLSSGSADSGVFGVSEDPTSDSGTSRDSVRPQPQSCQLGLRQV